MPRYDFGELTDYDFESLTGDLLAAELGLRFELFTPGPDRGIDLRHFRSESSTRTVIAQSKRWAPGAWSSLRQHLERTERPKLEQLQPDRYILVTSVQLTPDRKDVLCRSLTPWLSSPTDVYGRDDLIVLLQRHPEVERRHIKLWLTSTEVLTAVLNAGVLRRTNDVLERAKRQLQLWVPNQSFWKAKALLEESHICVLAGQTRHWQDDARGCSPRRLYRPWIRTGCHVRRR